MKEEKFKPDNALPPGWGTKGKLVKPIRIAGEDTRVLIPTDLSALEDPTMNRLMKQRAEDIKNTYGEPTTQTSWWKDPNTIVYESITPLSRRLTRFFSFSEWYERYWDRYSFCGWLYVYKALNHKSFTLFRPSFWRGLSEYRKAFTQFKNSQDLYDYFYEKQNRQVD